MSAIADAAPRDIGRIAAICGERVTTWSTLLDNARASRSVSGGSGLAEAYIRDKQNTYDGKHVTNPSGGLLSKGHLLGTTGLTRCYELTGQLRGTADRRRVEGVRQALQHNVGLGGSCVVTLCGRVP